MDIDKFVDGIKFKIDVNVKFGYNIPQSVNNFQKLIAKSIDYMTGINIFSIDVNVKSIDIDKKK